MKDLLNRVLRTDDNTIGDVQWDPCKDCPPETDLDQEDSVSQIASCQGTMSTTSSKLL